MYTSCTTLSLHHSLPIAPATSGRGASRSSERGVGSGRWGTSTRPEPVEGPLPQDHPLQRETPAGGLPAFVRCGLVPAYAVVGHCSSPRPLCEVVPANATSLRNAASTPDPEAGSSFLQFPCVRCFFKYRGTPHRGGVLST